MPEMKRVKQSYLKTNVVQLLDDLYRGEEEDFLIYAGYEIGEISCPTRYEEGSSSINLSSSIRYGLGVVITTILFRCHRWGLYESALFSPLDKSNSNA